MPTEIDQKFLEIVKVDKSLQRRNLRAARVLIEDTSEKSENFFNLSQLGDEFSLGKNAFIIRGTPNLKEGSPILVEILDVNGNPIYYEIPDYLEDVSRLVSVFVLENTPAGPAEITILGEAETRADGRPVPEEWERVFNVRWKKKINVNPNIYNTNNVRLRRQPILNLIPRIRTKLSPIFDSDFSDPERSPEKYKEILGSGSRKIASVLYPDEFGYTRNVLVASGWAFLREMRRNDIIIQASALPEIVTDSVEDPDLDLRLRIEEVIDENRAYVRVLDDQYEEFGKIINLENVEDWSLKYVANPIEFNDVGELQEVDMDFSRLRTIAGAINRVRIYRNDESVNDNREFVGDFEVAASELLVDRDPATPTRPNKRLGVFLNQIDIDDYLEPINCSLEHDNTNLLNSAQIIPDSGVDESEDIGFKFNQDLIGFELVSQTEYTLRYRAIVNNNDERFPSNLKAFIGGSVSSDISEEEVIISEKEFPNTSFQIVDEKVNFKPLKTTDDNSWNLKFVVEGGNWYITDISLTPRQDEGFSPDFLTFTLDVPEDPGEFKYEVDLFDLDNNKIPVVVESSNEIEVDGNGDLIVN